MAVKSPVIPGSPTDNNLSNSIITAKPSVSLPNNTNSSTNVVTKKPSVAGFNTTNTNAVATNKFNVTPQTSVTNSSSAVSVNKPNVLTQSQNNIDAQVVTVKTSVIPGASNFKSVSTFTVSKPTVQTNNTDSQQTSTIEKIPVVDATAPNSNTETVSITKATIQTTATTTSEVPINSNINISSDPTVVNQIETQSNTNVFLNTITPESTQNQTVYPLATQTVSGNDVIIAQNINNDAGDIVTVYNTSKSISVTSINQTVNDYTQLDTGVSQIIAGRNITITSSSGNGLGIVTISATGGGGNASGSYISNGSSNVSVFESGPVTIGIDGTDDVVVFDLSRTTINGSLFVSNEVNADTFNATSLILRDGKNVPTFVYQANVAPLDPLVGDQWYDTNTGTLFEYLDDGITAAWLDMNGNPGVVASNVNVNTTVIDTPYVEVGTTNTLIDSFDATVYRTAKYIISSSNPYDSQVSEVMVLQNNGVSMLNTYGSLNTGANVVSFFTNTSGTNVRLYAVGTTANNQLRIEKTYFLL